MKPFQLTHKTALVTGGASGIGRAIAETFAKNGARVVILDFNETQAKEVVEAFKAEGLELQYIICDVSKAEEIQQIVDDIASQNKIDILVNNAGVAHVGNIENTTEADLDRIYSINIKGVYNCVKAVIKHMKGNNGVIINMASIASSVGISDRFAYSMSKGAVLTMTYSIAKDYVDQGIRCNSISPARVHTPFVDGFIAKNYPDNQKEMFEKLSKTQPLGRMGKPAEIAHLALYLASDEASFITGTDFPIDGGFIKLNG
ncbi:SDR family NAD(P)-dependent oxidoreductase [Leeuwenhoekiella palythoae]|uniref:NAD(P)-dependent dehydrogenase (Short-subunit alcohol dehydrogenase family) n=1 Tax=Leeuwenhoekiella palythoae TaxID=573501 RepID=A0A1M5ZS66_9FLAO|nr:SDR family oxidoreductase [Leeuwenhoekiella palythoae]RXG26816.1 NAD(P)-dependent dehydrogenase (short-subunit alcohol dehydrogenase family) [Leeuwenhoekiella palythoae]SHI26936.1 NAD(P)-dependent dehydrogenase, short-chain alcohol dehydrogenase family [Leeuwenhoekiella palythoae]